MSLTRARLRRRGEAPHHPRHLRAVRRLLRRLLRPGAEGPHPDRARLRRRRSAQVDVLVSPTTPTTAFPIGERVDDPLAMYLHDLCTIPSNLAGTARCRCRSGARPRTDCRSACRSWRRRWPTTALPGRRRAGGRPGRADRPPADRGGSGAVTTLVPYETALEATSRSSASRSTSSSAPPPRCSAAARPTSAPSPTPRPARSAWACPARCRWRTRRRSSRSSGSAWR